MNYIQELSTLIIVMAGAFMIYKIFKNFIDFVVTVYHVFAVLFAVLLVFSWVEYRFQRMNTSDDMGPMYALYSILYISYERICWGYQMIFMMIMKIKKPFFGIDWLNKNKVILYKNIYLNIPILNEVYKEGSRNIVSNEIIPPP